MLRAVDASKPEDLGRQKGDWIILCAEEFGVRGSPSYSSNHLGSRNIGLGTLLRNLDTNAHSLFHELVHLTEAVGVTPDPPVIGPATANDRPLPGWPLDRQTWRLINDDGALNMPDDVMAIALYDVANQGQYSNFRITRLGHIYGRWAVHSPENYFWFVFHECWGTFH